MNRNEPLILSIDTSCDETAAAVTFGRRVLSNVVWSQIEIHRPWGGVVPDIARRSHKEHIDEVIANAIKRAVVILKRLNLKLDPDLSHFDAIAVTQGPGLAIALEVGIAKAKELAAEYNKSLIAVNHMEGHFLSSLAENSTGHGSFSRTNLQFPLLGLLVSGGHTEMVLAEKIGCYRIVGETLDDAAGEAFDKVAKMLQLGYPGGPIITELAAKGNPKKYPLPIPMARSPSLNFSFSGLKTACLYKLRSIPEQEKNRQFLADFAASFEKSLVRSITLKLEMALRKYQPKQILLGGGVINNFHLRQAVRKISRKHQIPVFTPYSAKLLTDNAAMIGTAAYYHFLEENFCFHPEELEREPLLDFPS